MKAIPLLAVAGALQPEGIYFNDPRYLQTQGNLQFKEISGGLAEYIGDPIKINVDYLEGKGPMGRLEHRGVHLVDLRIGGGMIQDLGTHALAPLFAMEEYIGKINPLFDGNVKVAHCTQYLKWVKQQFQLENSNIGETYAELSFFTARNVPVSIRLGKYVLSDRNQKHIRIIGTHGSISHDLSTNTLSITQHNECIGRVDTIPSSPGTDINYEPVIKSALNYLQGNNPFAFDPNRACLDVQGLILNILNRVSRNKNDLIFYDKGLVPEKIFS